MLIQRIQAGDTQAFDALVRKYYGEIYRFCYRRLNGDADTAADLTQDVFLKLLENIQAVHVLGKFRNYLLTIAANTCKNYFKKAKPICVDISAFELTDDTGSALNRIYGVQGWDASIQSSLHYASSAYDLTFLQMFLLFVGFNLLGLAAMTFITLYMSTKAKTPASALIALYAACFLPVLFDFTESVPPLQKLQEVCPIYMLHMNGVFPAAKTYGGMYQPVVMLIFNVCLVCVFCVLIRSTARKHQVTG